MSLGKVTFASVFERAATDRSPWQYYGNHVQLYYLPPENPDWGLTLNNETHLLIMYLVRKSIGTTLMTFYFIKYVIEHYVPRIIIILRK